MNKPFSYRCPTRLAFGEGAVESLGPELGALRVRSVLFVCGSGHTLASEGFARARASVEAAAIEAGVFSDVSHDPPIEQVEACARALAESGAEAIVAYGGGSPIDCAKAANLYAACALIPNAPQRGLGWADFLYGRAKAEGAVLPLVAIPSTAGAGSETSAAAVTTDRSARRKLGMSDDRFFPRLALVDPLLHASMPPGLTAATGMDALTHAVESLVSRNASPLSAAVSEESARLVSGALRRAVADASDREARSAMALGAAIVGAAFSNAGLGMVHGFAHPVGARAGVAHGVANAVLLPFVMEACAAAAPLAFARLARAFGLPTEGRKPEALAAAAVEHVRELGAAIGIPASLRALGLAREELPGILADALVYRQRAASPRAFGDEELGALLEGAWEGALPPSLKRPSGV